MKNTGLRRGVNRGVEMGVIMQITQEGSNNLSGAAARTGTVKKKRIQECKECKGKWR